MAQALFARTDTSRLGRWWWTVDRWLLLALCLLMGLGVLLSFAGTPFIAKKLGMSSFQLVEKQLFLFIPSFFLMIWISSLSLNGVRRLSFWIFALFLLCLMITPFIGMEIKGARRWLTIGPLSLQASEFVKPAFAVVTAWLLSHGEGEKESFPLPYPKISSTLLYGFVLLFLLLEPDLGMSFVISVVWSVQMFLAGLPLLWVLLAALLGMAGLAGSYFLFPHVASRIDRFLDPAVGDHYQINRSLEAFSHGGLFGQGPGEGVIKKYLPDAHSDFIFAVAGEEFGLFLCLFIVGIYAFILFRSFRAAFKDQSLFVFLSIGGLSVQFTTQALVNMASSLHLIPTKGMTLPFLSYGGSSLLALAIGMGMLLCFTRRRIGFIK